DLPGRLVHRAVPGGLPVAHRARGEPPRRRPARSPGSSAVAADVSMAAPLLEVDGLKTWFFTRDGVVRAVDGVSYSVARGETLAVVGESGCGKSVSAKSIIRLNPSPPARHVAGTIRFDGRDLIGMDLDELRQIRGNEISMIFQEPMTSLNPVLTIGR